MVVRDRKIVGALLIGDQRLSTPLRELIEAEVDISMLLPQLQDTSTSMTESILTFWQRWKEKRHEPVSNLQP